MQPLNPRLYAALKRVFGNVRISNEGVPMTAVYMRDWNRKVRLTPSYPGEYYIVACPYCNDSSGHLYINHRWGVRDPVTGTRNLWLANCFRGSCLSDWERREDLAELLEDYTIRAQSGAVSLSAPVATKPIQRVELPDDFQLLSALKRGHPARRYVRKRGFKPDILGNYWGVGFSSDAYRDDPGRLVIPLRAQLPDPTNGKKSAKMLKSWEVVGYLGRFLGKPRRHQPKYLTSKGTAKSHILYGLDRVPSAEEAPVIICEGPADVWRAGPGAVALLGKTISAEQCRSLRSLLAGRTFVVLLDPDAPLEAVKVAERLRNAMILDLTSPTRMSRVLAGELPDDRDPAECSRKEIWRAVRTAPRSARIKS